MAIKERWAELIAPAVRLWEKVIPYPKVREWVETIVCAVVLALFLRAFVIQAFWIPSESMVPTLLVGDRVLVCKFEYLIRSPKRGDVFIFKFPQNPKVDYVKRLIALPGDKFEVRDGVVWINDAPVDEPYVKFPDTYNHVPVYVPEKSYVALGDNRGHSSDSRYWAGQYGPESQISYVPEENICGPVLFRYWPLKRFGLVK